MEERKKEEREDSKVGLRSLKLVQQAINCVLLYIIQTWYDMIVALVQEDQIAESSLKMVS